MRKQKIEESSSADGSAPVGGHTKSQPPSCTCQLLQYNIQQWFPLKRQDPGVSPSPSLPSLYRVPSRSASLSMHTHTEHVLGFPPDCIRLVCLCVLACVRLRLHTSAIVCVCHDYMNYVSEGGGSVRTFACRVNVQLISRFHSCGVEE